MRSSKGVALAFVLGALLVGGVLGFTADRVIGRDDECARRFTRSAMRQRLGDELGLSATQRLALDSILDRKRAAIDALHAPLRPSMDAVNDSAEKAIDAMLDEEQRQKFARMRAENEQRDREVRQQAEKRR